MRTDDTAGTDPTPLQRARGAHSLTQQLEALLIVADEPLSVAQLASAAAHPVTDVRAALVALVEEYNGETPATARGFELREVSGGYRFYVRKSLDPVVASFVQQQAPAKLSQAALETLAVIAYRQPISRAHVASIRAVNVDSVVRNLLSRGLITEAGNDPETSATLYGTTDALLRHLGIDSLSELPPIAPLLDEPTENFENENLR